MQFDIDGMAPITDVDQRLEHGARYQDKRQVAKDMWQTNRKGAGMNYVMRQGRRIEVKTISDPGTSFPRKRKPFKAQFVMIPLRWVETLQRSKSARTYQLALVILLEAFKLEAFKRKGSEITLSSTVTKMPRNTKTRAAKELADLGLIEIKQIGN